MNDRGRTAGTSGREGSGVAMNKNLMTVCSSGVDDTYTHAINTKSPIRLNIVETNDSADRSSISKSNPRTSRLNMNK